MTITTYLLVMAVIVSAMAFAYPLTLFYRFLRFEPRKTLKWLWAAMIAACVGFYGGYLVVIFHLIRAASLDWSDQVVVFLLVSGSIFVALVARLLSSMVFSLDHLVKERTEELERVYARALEKEREAQRLKDHFVFVAAHELRTPVTAMRWSLEVIREFEKGGGDPKEIYELVDGLDKAVQELTSLVNDLLDTSRLEYGTVTLNPEFCAVGDLLDESLKALAPIGAKEGIKLERDWGDFGIRQVKLDKRRVQEVVTNLVSNAIKFTMPGGAVKVFLTKKGKHLAIGVSDTGAGLDREDLPRLFQKFAKIDNHPKKDIPTTGLGLYIAKSLVDLWEGRIWAESPGRGQGSTFYFTLPTNG